MFQQQQQRPQSAAGSRPWTPNKPAGSANGNGVHSTHARPQQAQPQPPQRSFIPPPHARQLQPQSQARPSPPSQKQAQQSNGAHAMASGSKTVNFMSSSRGGGDSDDDGPRVDELLSSAALLPRTISFKKSTAAFSSSSAHAAAPSNAFKLQAQSPHANGGANGTAHRPATANGVSKSPAVTASSPVPRPPSHAGNNKLGSPSAPGQLKAKQQQQQQNGAPRPSSASASLTVPVVHIKDPNQFRWPKKYLYPSTSVSALLNWNKFDKIGCGLSNLGNTCFLNAVLQALAYTPPLANYLRRGEHSKSCRVRTAKTPDQFCLFCALEQTCNSMAAAKHSAIQPRLIVTHLRAISRSFRLGRQEDSHEFLRFVMEMLQKNDLAAYGGSALVKDIRIQETTALFGIFGGYFRSQVRCLSCQYRSNTYDAFLDLSLELAHVSSVAQALASFTRPEKLDKDNLYNCSQCKRKVRAEKQLTIFKAPTVLCVHLKRFQFAQQFGGKINKPIDFRERLQLGPAMSDLASNPSYSLYAVLVHSGHSTNSGHYYCYVKSSSGQWHLMDDSSVRQVGLQHVLEQRAYILFYVRTAIETLPVAAPSPGMSPAIAPAAQAAMASKIAQLNLDAAAKKFATTAAMAAHANGVAAKAKPAAAAAQPEDDSYSEGDSDEGEEHVPAVKAKAKSPQMVQPKAAAVAVPQAKASAAAAAAQAQSDSDASMDEDEDDDEIDEDEEIDSDSASMDDALYGSSSAMSGRGGVPAHVRRHASRRTSRLNSLSLHLQPGQGGPPRFAHCIYAFLKPRASPRKRRRIVEEDEEDEDDNQSGDDGDASMSDSDTSSVAPAPAPKSSNRPAAEQVTKRQKTDSNTANGPSKNVAVSAPASASAAAPASKRFEPVYFNQTNTPPSPASAPAPTSSPTPSVSSSAAAAAAPAASSSAATPAKAAPSPAPAAPRSSGPIIVSREAFDPRLMNRSFSSTQFGASVGDWETSAQADTSAKYQMKRKQDIANSKLVPQQKPKDQWDEELDKGHVRKTKTGKSTELSADGYGATSGNMFQLAQNARNSKKADERAGIATPEKGRGGGGGGDKSKQRGAQRGFKAKGFTTHKERNAQKKSGKGRKGPRDFSA